MHPSAQRPPSHATLIGDDGRVHTVSGTALVGRSPTITSDHGVVSLIVIEDDALGLSKTHAVFRFEDGQLWVRDDDSRNGTSVSRHDGGERVCSGEWTAVGRGDYVRLGARWLRVGESGIARA